MKSFLISVHLTLEFSIQETFADEGGVITAKFILLLLPGFSKPQQSSQAVREQSESVASYLVWCLSTV